MILKDKILFILCITYWILIGVGVFTVTGFGLFPIFMGLTVLISLIFIVFFTNRNLNIMGLCGLYFSSIL
ncbi:hypothetical protein M2132_000183 [Dysgonomonas sp. PH5-45]|nr:hypothetical protein [Dysgonomonas sp. PH5-45]MDH6386769.1 hypothetical protein [Dysgonomonas sp. PH5-37]